MSQARISCAQLDACISMKRGLTSRVSEEEKTDRRIREIRELIGWIIRGLMMQNVIKSVMFDPEDK